MYELAIIGGGPAGVAGGVYAARKQLDTKLITESFGGQSEVSPEINNWIGTQSISGADWADKLEAHLRSYEGEQMAITDGARVTNLKRSDSSDGFIAVTDDGDDVHAQSVLIASGADRKRLNIPGAEKFENKGVVYCASCDGPLFSGQDVVVVGGGNAGFESAAELLAYSNSVTLLHRRDEFKADPVTVEKVQARDNFTAVTNVEPVEINGEQFVESLVYKNVNTGEQTELPAGGVFVEIGLVPNTDFAADVVETNDIDQIKVDPATQKTSTEGIWAAGDCTDGLYHQNNIAAGDGIKAVEDIYLHLRA